MKYLTAKQIEALSPVKREVYEKRLTRDLERKQEKLLRDSVQVPKYVPIRASLACCTLWIESSRLRAMAAAVATEQQYSEKLKNEIASLYEES